MTTLFTSGPAVRHLTSTKVLQYSPTLVFNVFSDIASYKEFSTSVDTSEVTSKDSNGLPTKATLNVGWPPIGLTEEWLCQAKCDRKAGIVEVRNVPGSAGTLEVWIMRWTISPAPATTSGKAEKKQATVTVDLELKFRNSVMDGMFAVLPSVAEKTVLKFERRVAEVDEMNRKAEAQKQAATKNAKKGKDANGRPRKLEVRSISGKSTASLD